MDLNIDKLDLDEKNKIATLLRERRGGEEDKGVDYIFKGPNNQEEYLLGKKIDLHNIVNDERALMGESECEFKERMERKKMLVKMREDPMSIIQFNEQYNRKIAMEKNLVHQKFIKKDEQRMQNRRRRSSTDSEDNDDALKALQKLVQDNLSSDDEEMLTKSTMESKTVCSSKSRKNTKSRKRSNSSINDSNSGYEKNKRVCREIRSSSKEKYHSSKSRNENLDSMQKIRSRSNDRHKNEIVRKNKSHAKNREHDLNRRDSRERTRRYDRNMRRSKSEKRGNHRNNESKRYRSRSRDRNRRDRENYDERRHQDKNKTSTSKCREAVPTVKLNAEELEKKRKEMENNSKDINMRRNQIYDMNKKTEATEKSYMKNVKMDDEFFHLKATSIRSEESLTDAIRVKAAQNRVKKVFGR